MPTFTAAQHFFTSVPADQSPQKRRGYQTLFRTAGLSAEVVRAIEDRAQYTTAPSDPVKHQFYALPGGQWAVSQTVALAELDEFGRKGRYLTHTLVLNATAFQSLSYSPLDVLTQFPFATALAPVFQQGQLKTGEIAPATVATTPDWQAHAYRAAQQYPANLQTRLGRLGWQAGRLLEKRTPVILTGSDAEQLTVLGIIFLLASPAQRAQMSFDTHATGCDWGKAVTFWALGYAGQPEVRSGHEIETQTRQTTSSLTPADDGPYARWMTKAAIPSGLRLDAFDRKQGWAAHIEAVLAGSATERLSIPESFSAELAAEAAPAVAACWAAQFPPGLTPPFTQRLTARIAANPAPYLAIVLEGLQPAHIVEFMFMELLALMDVPPKSDRSVLEKWIKATDDPSLRVLAALWAKDGKAWVTHLLALPPKRYEYMVRELARWPQPPLPLWEALVGPHATAWITLAGPMLPAGDWKKALAVLEKLPPTVLDTLAKVTPQLPQAARAEIAKWLKGYKGEAAALRQALGLTTGKDDKKFKLF